MGKPVLAWLVVALLAGCAKSTQPPKRTYDLAFTLDLTVPDLDDGDLGEDGFSGPDMARGWIDQSYPTAESLWTAWSNGAGVAMAAGGTMGAPDTNIILKSTGGAAFVADTSTKPSVSQALSLYAASPGPPTNPLYVVGDNGSIWANDGNLATGNGTWTAETSGTTATLYGVWTDATGNGFAVGSGVALKRSGSVTWSALTGIASTNQALGLWANETAGVYTVYAGGNDEQTTNEHGIIWKSTGAAFTVETSTAGTGVIAMWGSSTGDIYAVGAAGLILHSTGDGTWTPQTSPVDTDLEAIYGASADEVYAVGDGGVVLHKYGAGSTTWEKEAVPSTATDKDFFGVWADPQVVYVVGSNGAIIKK